MPLPYNKSMKLTPEMIRRSRELYGYPSPFGTAPYRPQGPTAQPQQRASRPTQNTTTPLRGGALRPTKLPRSNGGAASLPAVPGSNLPRAPQTPPVGPPVPANTFVPNMSQPRVVPREERVRSDLEGLYKRYPYLAGIGGRYGGKVPLGTEKRMLRNDVERDVAAERAAERGAAGPRPSWMTSLVGRFAGDADILGDLNEMARALREHRPLTDTERAAALAPLRDHRNSLRTEKYLRMENVRDRARQKADARLSRLLARKAVENDRLSRLMYGGGVGVGNSPLAMAMAQDPLQAAKMMADLSLEQQRNMVPIIAEGIRGRNQLAETRLRNRGSRKINRERLRGEMDMARERIAADRSMTESTNRSRESIERDRTQLDMSRSYSEYLRHVDRQNAELRAQDPMSPGAIAMAEEQIRAENPGLSDEQVHSMAIARNSRYPRPTYLPALSYDEWLGRFGNKPPVGSPPTTITPPGGSGSEELPPPPPVPTQQSPAPAEPPATEATRPVGPGDPTFEADLLKRSDRMKRAQLVDEGADPESRRLAGFMDYAIHSGGITPETVEQVFPDEWSRNEAASFIGENISNDDYWRYFGLDKVADETKKLGINDDQYNDPKFAVETLSKYPAFKNWIDTMVALTGDPPEKLFSLYMRPRWFFDSGFRLSDYWQMPIHP